MKKIMLMCAVALGLSAVPAQAALFTTNFCPGDADCPADITQARIVFEELGGNQYNVYVGFQGGAAAPAYITAIDFTISGVKGEVGAGTDDYAFDPILVDAPGGTSKWTVSFDKLSFGDECDGDGAGQALCVESVGIGTGNAALGPNTLNIWKLSIALDSGVAALSTATKVDLRAQFATAAGANGGNFSPTASNLTTPDCTTCSPTDLFDVPEPASLALLGLGLLGAGLVRRQK